ncbi:BMC domain-containing protein [Paenibacillus thiaminolyticus]|uniref:BMC domain-containing protein n=1 Tax=Paenibacillus thiaminolyticus TaxID=49283 RepID=UPI0011659EB2|nr:BMC domain-containing protein [Paenibacillus thiaminolyticus]NGP61574.1 BMC domain-containing protein [Paenibacillus thiaminolyticus]
MTYDAIGVIEARYFATALEMTDAMSKAAQVEWLASEKALGGRLVTIVIGGDVANVKAAVEAAKAVCAGKADNPLAHAAVILKPHAEIMKFVMPAQAGEEGRAGSGAAAAAGDEAKTSAATAEKNKMKEEKGDEPSIGDCGDKRLDGGD